MRERPNQIPRIFVRAGPILDWKATRLDGSLKSARTTAFRLMTPFCGEERTGAKAI